MVCEQVTHDEFFGWKQLLEEPFCGRGDVVVVVLFASAYFPVIAISLTGKLYSL